MFKKSYLIGLSIVFFLGTLFAAFLQGKTAAEYVGVSDLYPISRIELHASDYNDTYPPHCLILDPEEDAELYNEIIDFVMTQRFLLWKTEPQLVPLEEIPESVAIECRIPLFSGTGYRSLIFGFLENGKICFNWYEQSKQQEVGYIYFLTDCPFSFERIEAYIVKAE